MNADIRASVVDYDPFSGGSVQQVVPTTEPQKEIWLADRLGVEASLAFNESISLRLRGRLDPQLLRIAVQALVDRHDVLRSSFAPDGETLCILEQVELDLPILDLAAMGPEEQGAVVSECAARAVGTPFALEQGNLFRCQLLCLSDADHVLVLSAHHIVCDGWSWWVLVRELGALYAQGCGPGVPALPAPPSFADYALQQADAGSSAGAADQQYWLSQFSGPLPVLELPTDRPRPPQRSFASKREDLLIEAELLAGIRSMGSRQGASLFATLLAGFSALLSRLSGESAVVIGVPAAGQALDEWQGLVGHCVNLLPLRFELDASQPFAQAIVQAQATLLDGLEHQRYTFGTLLKKLSVARDPSRMPLVNVMFNIDQAMEQEATDFPGLAMDLASNPRICENFELFVNAVQVRGQLRLECQYNCDLFDAVTVRRWLLAYECLLRSAVDKGGMPLASLPLLGDSGLAELAALQPMPVVFDRTLAMHEFFEYQCDRTPEAIAVHSGPRSTSYAGLDARANRIARLLRAQGIRRGALVGLAMDRGPDLLAGLLGILKSGAAYVPLDPGFPPERLSYMTADANLSALVTERRHASCFDLRGRPVLALDELETQMAALAATRLERDEGSAAEESPAYVIYTSGSTGRPKGVLVPHRAVANFISAMASQPGLGAHDRLVAVTTLSFDIAVLELLLPLSVGGQVVIASRETAGDGVALADLLLTSRATVMQATPATWLLLLESGWQGGEHLMALCGGESLPAELAGHLLERCAAVWNLYGPTETTVWSTCARIEPPLPGRLPDVHIGRPIANTRIWILDARGELLPRGVPGEICIGGEGVTLGYLDRPELTAERFITDRFPCMPLDSATGAEAPGATGNPRLYRTGDRGRWRNDGNLEHLGRLDSQVKVRGFRIELGEIEAQAMALAPISQALAAVHEVRPGDVRIVLYVVSQPLVQATEILAHLRRVLPDYMIPQHVIQLEAIPRLPNGKANRSALPAPAVHPARSGRDLPRTELERRVVAAMQDVLGLPTLGIHEDFFASGGHSLLAAQLTTRLGRQVGTTLSLRSLFDAPTAARLAATIEQQGHGQLTSMNQPIPQRADASWAPLSAAQDRLRLLEEFSPGRVTYNLPSAHRLSGPLDTKALVLAFRTMIGRQTVLRTVIGARDGQAVQLVLDQVAIGLEPLIDLSALPAAEREAELLRRLGEMSELPFKVDGEPLFRAALFRLGPESHALFFMPHHLVWDGWSFDLMYEEMAELYAAFSEGRAPRLPELPVSYGDYVAWHNQWLQGPEYAAQRQFWRQRLAGSDASTVLPRDKPGAAGMSGRGSTVPVVIPLETVEALRRTGLQHESTLFMTVLAAYFVLLFHASGRDDLIIGTPVRGRNNVDVEHLMGFFTTLLPLRTSIDPLWSFSDLVDRVRSLVLDSFANPDILLEDLQVEPGKRGPRNSSLYHALFSFQDARRRNQHWGALTHERIALFQRGATEDLGLWFLEDDQGLQGGLVYNDEVLLAETADALHRRLVGILARVAEDPALSIAALADAGLSKPAAAAPALIAATAPAELAQSEDAAAQQDPRERLLTRIFQEVIGIDAIGPEDNFFDLGGTSLLAIRLVKRVEQASGVRLNLIRLATGTVGSLARELPEAAPPSARGMGALWRRWTGRADETGVP